MYTWSVPETNIPHNLEQGSIYRYNIQLWRVRLTTVAVKTKQCILSSLLYRAYCFNLFFIVPTHALHYTSKY